MQSRTLTASVVTCAACAACAVVIGVGLGQRRQAPVAAAAMPFPTAALTPMPALPPPAAAAADDTIQIALVLDTSGHMDDFIASARTHLWTVVDAYAQATRQGRQARLEVALYEYGSGALPAGSGYVRQVRPFTDELAGVERALLALGTQDGAEYGGQVIQQASEELAWSDSPGALRLVYIAGSGRLDQGPVDHRVALAAARKRGIRINTLHYGDDEPSWGEVAQAGQGEYLRIAAELVAPPILAPQDDELARLRAALDAQGCNPDAETLGTTPFDELPAEARLLTAVGRQDYVAERTSEAERLQARVDELEVERGEFVQAERARRGEGAEAAVDTALLEALHAQAAQAGYRFE